MKMSVFGAFAVLLVSTSAFAADLYQPEPIQPIEEPPVTVVEASGWYLRGDAGYSFNHLRGAKYFQGSNSYERDFDHASLRDAFTLGAGVGYQVNRYLRTDLTFDYMFRSKFNGSTSGGGSDFGACVVACTSKDVASLTAFSLLANAYVDVGTWGSVTPYVGAGIGGTYVKWNKLKNTSCSDSDPTNCDGTVEHGGKGSWRFTYALMAGASVDVTCNIKADVGYRFRHVDGGKMFGYASNGGPGYDKGFTSHEGRVGMRYIFNGCAEQAYIPPADIPLQQPVYK
ncbi:porin family protein [Rhizobium sp. LjRoot30]|uniref:outer membrane protein n=1 Tax=Rhizobium sp. LjRoot30 TaxID=3342320 RepID=UPI003ED0BE88